MNKLRTIQPQNCGKIKNSQPKPQFYKFILRKECSQKSARSLSYKSVSPMVAENDSETSQKQKALFNSQVQTARQSSSHCTKQVFFLKKCFLALNLNSLSFFLISVLKPSKRISSWFNTGQHCRGTSKNRSCATNLVCGTSES